MVGIYFKEILKATFHCSSDKIMFKTFLSQLIFESLYILTLSYQLDPIDFLEWFLTDMSRYVEWIQIPV